MNDNVVKKEFDLKAREYDSNRLAQWYQAHAQEIVKHCPQFDHGDILDIGCATGHQLRLLSKTHPNARLIGLDMSPLMIKQAQLQAGLSTEQIQFVTDDWENLDSDNRVFLDQFNFRLIICANTLHYFNQPNKAIMQMYEMLDNGGMLLVLEREKSRSALTLFWGFLHRHFIKDQVEFYTADTLKEYLSAAGLKNVEIASTIKKYFWKGKLFTSIAIIKGKKPNDKSNTT